MDRSVIGLLVLLGGTACGGDTPGNTIIPPVPVPAQLAYVSGDKQAALITHRLALPLVVMVKNSDGSPASSAAVNWTVTAGGGLLSPSPTELRNSSISSSTDAGGVTSVGWILGSAIGPQTVLATAPGLNGSPVTFSATGTASPLILQNTGAEWNVALSDTTDVGGALASVWGSASSEIFAVGRCSDVSLVIRYDGSRWSAPTNCPSPGMETPFADQYTSVWGNTPSDVFAVRQFNGTMGSSVAIDHFDGQSWTQIYEGQCSTPCALTARAIWTGRSGSAIAVGGNGSVLRYDGAAWNAETSGTTANLDAIWGSGPSGPVFAVGQDGTIIMNAGSGWLTETSGTSQPLYAVWGTSANDIFAAGGGGTILHYDGNAWTAQASGTTQTLRALWGSANNSVFAVGDATTILHYDGTAWAAQRIGPTVSTPITLTGVWGISPTTVIAVGSLFIR
jgi:hypothetical protein